jgi:hypothetical protein
VDYVIQMDDVGVRTKKSQGSNLPLHSQNPICGPDLVLLDSLHGILPCSGGGGNGGGNDGGGGYGDGDVYVDG